MTNKIDDACKRHVAVKQKELCAIELVVIAVLIFGILLGTAIGYIRDYPEAFYQPGAQIIDEIEMNDAKPEHSALCGYHVNVDEEYEHVKWALRQTEAK